jgi:hypothetical protein
MLYLYAITERARPPLGTGLHGSPLRTIGEDGLFAIASAHDRPHAELTEGDLWAYEDVVEAVMEDASVLPMRLGSSVSDEAAVRETLRRRRAEFRRALDRVNGAVELAVRAMVPGAAEREPAPAGVRATEGEADAHGPGTVYMLGRLEAERRCADAAARIHEPLASLARESVRRDGLGGGGVLNAAYLVDRAKVGSFQERVEELVEELAEATIVCTGPWPPYSFSGAEPVR